MRKDPDTWQPHLDRLKDEAGKIAAAVERFAEMVGAELARLRDPSVEHAFDRPGGGAANRCSRETG